MYRRLIILCILPLIFVACSGGGEEIVLPTRVIIPTETPSSTWTPIPPTATSTPTPTATETPLPTNTPRPTSTPRPSQTPLPTLTPFMTETPTPSPTNIPTETPTEQVAIMIPTQDIEATSVMMPEILSFTASTTNAQTGTAVTLTWDARAVFTRIDQTTLAGDIQQSFDIPATGNLVVTIPQSSEGQVIYRLIAAIGENNVARSIPIIVPITPQCAIPWFFGAPPQGTECPSSAASTTVGKMQTFQNGVMFTMSVNGQERLFGLSYADRRYMSYAIGWDGTSSYTQPCGTPPEGLTAPQDVFNWAYHNTLAPQGYWCDATYGIGWATTVFSTGLTYQIQFTSNSTAVFVNLPGIGVIQLQSGLTQHGSWSTLN
jgi:hypothetical protein